MASKDKLLASAQKFLSKGQVSKAIGEYQKLVDSFPKDIRNRQKLAELFSRDKRSEEALKEYETVAKHYTETGFYLKAIAVFKQMQKIEPSRVDIYHRLAELNEKQGLVGNALTEYRNLVAFYDKNEMYHEAIEVLEKMAELEPENLNVAAKVAECHKAVGQTDEALEKFQEIIMPLVAKGEHIKVVKLYERFLDICPEEDKSRLPLAISLSNTGEAEKAVQLLKGMLKHAPEDVDVNKALTDAYVANNDYANARLTLKHLLKQEEKDLDLREYYVRICIGAGELERARDRLEDWKDDFFQNDRVEVLQGLYEELRDLLADDVVVSETLNVIYETIGDTSKIVKTEEPDQDDTPVIADEPVLDEAIDDVETVDMVGEEVDPGIAVPDLNSKKGKVDGPPEKTAAIGLELDLDLEAPVDDLEEPAASSDEEPPAEVDDEEEVPVDEDVEIEIDLDDMGDLDIEFDTDDVSGDAVAATGDDEDTSEPDVDVAVEITDESAELELDESFDLEPEADIAAQIQDVEDFEPADAEEEQIADLSSGEELELEVDVVSPSLEEEEAASDELPVEDIAELSESEELEAGEESAVEEELDNLEDVEELEDLEEVETLEEIEELEEVEPAVADAGSFAAALNVEAELEEAEFYLQQGLYDDASRVVATLLEYRPDLAELHEKMAEINQGRQAAEEEASSDEFVDILGDIQDDDLLAATDFLDTFGATSDTEDELTQKTVSELDSTDTESHFNLGIAYKEMGLYDDAIEEFSKASQDPARTVDCMTLTGQCYMEAGQTDAALETFKKGLAQEGLTEEGRMTLNFEMGMLYQLNGQLLEALEYFQLVAEKDSFFRDVSDLIKNLRKELGLDGADDDDGPQGNRDRVSYV